MVKPTSTHGANAQGQSKPHPIQIHIRQPIVIAALIASAGFALLSSTKASAPIAEKSEAQASLELISDQQPPIAFSVPAELKSESLAHTTASRGTDVVELIKNAAASANNESPGAPGAFVLALPQELSLRPAPEMLVSPQPLPPKVKGAFPRGLHPVIKHSMVEASRYLPEGWQLEFMNALRDAPGVWNGPHGKRDKTGGALAVDVWLVNPKGERLCNFKCAQNFEPYQTFMQMVKFIQDRDFPAYRNQGRWGGYFGGSYANDEMHYDLEPSAWTAAGNWEKGLYPQYAYFGKKSDVGKGMGQIASYRLPATGTMLASMETPVHNTNPVAVASSARPSTAEKVAAPAPARTPVAPPAASALQTASITPVAVQPGPAKRITPMQQVAQQWKMRPARAQYRQRYESDDDGEARSAYRAQARYAQAQRSGRRGTSRAMRDYGDE